MACSSRFGSCGSGPSSSAMRRRRSAANAGRGASGIRGSRSASNASVIGVTSCVRDPERVAGAYEQRFRRVHRPVQVSGDLGYREPVDVAQRKRRAMVRAQLVENLAGARALEAIGDVVALLGGFGQQLQTAFLSRLA